MARELIKGCGGGGKLHKRVTGLLIWEQVRAADLTINSISYESCFNRKIKNSASVLMALVANIVKFRHQNNS